MLKQGDLVKYHRPTKELDLMGFVQGRVYMVKRLMATDDLIVNAIENRVVSLQDKDGLTDESHHFAKFVPIVDLPRGVSK